MEQWHARSIEETIRLAGADPARGLSSEEAAGRLERHGPNRLVERKGPGLLRRFLAQINDALIYILLAAAAISAALGEYSDAIIILAVVCINAVMGVIQESKAEKAISALRKLSAPKAIVVRDGAPREIDALEVVPGDTVLVEAGRVLPCDLRWTQTVNLRVEEASLTGESVPAEKDAGCIVEEATPLGDRRNMGYLSTVCTYGRGVGIAVGTGMNTLLGGIAAMLEAEPTELTPLQGKLGDFGRKLGVVIVVLCGVMFAVSVIEELARHGAIPRGSLFELFLTSISLAVAAIPEGLPAIVTIVLAIGMQLMSRERSIVRRLPAVETLGSVTMICSDKTGTLTRNRMAVTAFSSDGVEGGIDGVSAGRRTHALMLQALALCNDASPGSSDGVRAATGDPTEVALLEAAAAAGVGIGGLRGGHPRLMEVPFDSTRKMMSTVHAFGDERLLLAKGAVDALLDRSERIRVDGRDEPLTPERKAEALSGAERMASRALRVLGAAYRPLRADERSVDAASEAGLIFLGAVGMIDPPRMEVRESIAACAAAGVGVAMITGDHKATALAIAGQLGIAAREHDAISGTEIDALDDAGLAERARTARVFARVSPEHKVRIVKAFRANGHVVSMTGDGVNDAPSLKAADIGVAMGITGTDVAKGAADMILTDDNFGTIVKAVEAGRNIYANIRKAVLYLLSCNLGEILTIFPAMILGLPIPLLPIHLLWVNLVTDTFPALALGMDPGDPDAMKERPRGRNESLFAHGGAAFVVSNGVIKGGLTLSAFLAGMAISGGSDLGLARTMAFCVLSLCQLFHAFNSRHLWKSLRSIHPFGNRWLLAAFGVGTLIQVLVVAVPPFASFFKTVPLSLGQWGIVAGLSASTVLLNELAKLGVRIRLRATGRPAGA
jgi:P-type Ca2+ transporter type 2C